MTPGQENLLFELRDQLVVIRREIEENTAKTEQIRSAFPAGDTDGHRRYHESVIEWRELRNKVVREGLIKVGQAGVLAGSMTLIGIIWKALKISITQ